MLSGDRFIFTCPHISVQIFFSFSQEVSQERNASFCSMDNNLAKVYICTVGWSCSDRLCHHFVLSIYWHNYRLGIQGIHVMLRLRVCYIPSLSAIKVLLELECDNEILCIEAMLTNYNNQLYDLCSKFECSLQ